MKKKRIIALLSISAIMSTSLVSLAASAVKSYKSPYGEVTINSSVSFVEGPLTLQDKYWEYCSITGKDRDLIYVDVNGWVSNKNNQDKKTMVTTTLNYNKYTTKITEKKCGYGRDRGSIKVSFPGGGSTITAID